MESASYFKAAIPEPFRIFGIRLLPLSLGRYRLLSRFGCAFVAEGEASATVDDLLLGILICSMRCQEFLEFIEGDNFKTELRRWGSRIRAEIEREDHFSILGKYELFQRYIAEGSELPKYWDEGRDQGTSGAHWSHNVEVTLRAELGYTREEIEEGALSQALADYFKYAENQGMIRLMSEGEIAGGDENMRVLMAALGTSVPATKEAQCPA
jgi:hypothetical protein